MRSPPVGYRFRPRFLSAAALVIGQTLFGGMFPGVAESLEPGDPAPDFVLRQVLQGPEEIRLEDLEGQVVLLDFWATWCAPCVAAIPQLDRLVEETADLPFTLISISDEDPERLREFQERHPMTGWSAVDLDGSVFEAYGVVSRPHGVLIDPEGIVRAVTYPSEVDRGAIEALLAGRDVSLEAKSAVPSNLNWDVEAIEWLDGIRPLTQVIIKPIRTATAGYLYRPGSDRFTGDGLSLLALVSAAWRVDPDRIEFAGSAPDQTYRVVARVPEGREEGLLPLLRRTVEATFGLETEWVELSRPVHVLVAGDDRSSPEVSTAPESEFWAMRGTIHGRKQPVERLVDFLCSFLGRTVVDETGLVGLYDWDLEYSPADPDRLERSLRSELGLDLVEAQREVKILRVTSKPERDFAIEGEPGGDPSR